MTKKAAIQKIKALATTSFNAEQKAIAINMIEKAPDEKVDQWLSLILQRVKLGFRFDYAPEPDLSKIVLAEEATDLAIIKAENQLTHKLIIGENYDGLKNLLITHRNAIDIIYIDPPYNTEAAESDGNSDQFNQAGEYKRAQKVTIPTKGKFVYRDKFARTGWLNLLHERLKLARDLLTDNGVIFVSIDDNEQAYLKVLMDEIFDENNFICNFDWISKPGGQSDNKFIAKTKQYILMYKKSNEFKIKQKWKIIKEKDIYGEDKKGKYLKSTELNALSSEDSKYAWSRPNLAFHFYYNPNSKVIKFTESWDLKNNKPIPPVEYKDFFVASPKKENTRWRWSRKQIIKKRDELIFEIKNGRLKIFKKEYVFDDKKKSFISDGLIRGITQGKGTTELKEIFGISAFDYPKPSELVKKLINLSNNENATILDFFAGSGTTMHATIDLNREDNGKRECILITNNENNIAYDVTYERLHRIIKREGTKGEKDFLWLNKQINYADNNLQVFKLKEYDVSFKQIGNLDALLKHAEEQLQKLNPRLNFDEKTLLSKLQYLYPVIKNK